MEAELVCIFLCILRMLCGARVLVKRVVHWFIEIVTGIYWFSKTCKLAFKRCYWSVCHYSNRWSSISIMEVVLWYLLVVYLWLILDGVQSGSCDMGPDRATIFQGRADHAFVFWFASWFSRLTMNKLRCFDGLVNGSFEVIFCEIRWYL